MIPVSEKVERVPQATGEEIDIACYYFSTLLHHRFASYQ